MNESPLPRMKVTAELLERYEACDEGVKWLQENYPNGIEVMDALALTPSLPPEFICWGIKYLGASDEEVAAANRVLKINTSTRVYGSYEVYNSDFVVASHNVNNSKKVHSSNNISSSENIHGSSDISDSNNIYDSQNVKYGQNIHISSSIQFSTNIVNSNSISWSEGIINSLNIEGGYYSALCEDSYNVAFCVAGKRLKNCCLCFGSADANNLLFNKPSTPQRVAEVIEKLKEFSLELNGTLDRYKITRLCKNLPEKMEEYIRSLPEFDEFIFTEICI